MNEAGAAAHEDEDDCLIGGRQLLELRGGLTAKH